MKTRTRADSIAPTSLAALTALPVALAVLAFAMPAFAEPIQLDRVDEPCCPIDIERLGDLLVVAYDDPDDLVGLRVYDYTDPASPQYVSEVELDAAPTSMDLSWWDYLYVATATGGLRVVNLAVPGSPVVVGSAPVTGEPFRIEVRGWRAYVGTHSDGFHVFDLSSPTSPSLMTTFGDDGRTLSDFDVSGTLVGFCALLPVPTVTPWRVLNFADPSAPALVAVDTTDSSPAWQPCSHVSTNGSDFFAEGPQYYDQPSQGGNFNMHAIVSYAYGSYSDASWLGHVDIFAPLDGLAAHGSLAFALSGGRLSVFEADELWGAGLLGTSSVWPGGDPINRFVETDVAWKTTRPFRLHAEGGLVFSTAGPVDVATFDVSDPANPALLSVLRPDGDLAVHVEVSGDAAIVSDDVQGLRLFDVSKPWMLTPVATLPSLGGEIEVEGDLLFVGSTDPWGLQIVDVATPSAPVLLGFAPLPVPDPLEQVERPIIDLAVDGTTLVAMVAESGVHVFDVSNPLAPLELGSYATFFAQTLDVQGTLVALAWPGDYSPWYPPYGSSSLLDISNPAAPVQVAQLRTDDQPSNVKIVDDHVFLFADDVMWVYDVTIPATPVEVTSMPIDHKIWSRDGDVEIVGTRLFVAHGDAGVSVVDISDPSAPFIEALWIDEASVESFAVADDVLFAAEGIDGFASYAIDASAVPISSWPMSVGLAAFIGAGARMVLRRRA